MIYGLLCGALLTLFMPLSWRFLATSCGDTPMLLRAYVCGAAVGALAAFFGVAHRVRFEKRPHGAVLAAVFALVMVIGIFPPAFADSVFATWQKLSFFRATPGHVLRMTLLWGGVAGLCNGVLAGLLASSMPGPRKIHLPMFLHLLLGVVVALALLAVLPASRFDVALRSATLLLAGLVAALGFCHGRRKVKGWLLLAGVAVVAVMVLGVKTARDVPLLMQGPFGYWAARDNGFIPMRGKTSAPVAEGHSANHEFAVYDDPVCGRVVVVDALPIQADGRFRTPHVLSAVIPFLRAPEAKRALFVGDFASRAAVAGEALPLENMEVWEPIRGLFIACGGNVSNATIRLGDGRAALAGREVRDIVVVDPGPLWRRGALAWTTPSAFKQLRRSLAPNGVVAVHLDGRGLTPLMLQRIVQNFLKAGFAETCLWNTGMQDYLLTGGSAAPELEDAVDALRDHAPLFRELATVGIQSLPDVLSTLLLDNAAAIRFADAPHKETARLSSVRAWRSLFNTEIPAHLLETLAHFQTRELTWALSGNDAPDVYDVVTNRMDAAIQARLAALPAIRAFCTNDLASALAPLLMSRLTYARLPLVHDFGDRVELTGRQVAAAENYPLAYQYFFTLQLIRPGSWSAQYDYAKTLRKLNKNEEAYTVLSQAAALAPGMIALRFEKAEFARQLFKWNDARDDYTQILAHNPTNIVALTEYAKFLANRDNPLRNMDYAISLAERAAKLTQFKEPLAVITLGDIYILAGRAVDGVKLKQAFREEVKSEK